MLKFIAACMGIVAFAFFAMPVFFNVANEREAMIEMAQADAEIPSNDGLVATNDVSDNEDIGAMLNNITPAAGAPINTAPDESFGAAFEQKSHPAL